MVDKIEVEIGLEGGEEVTRQLGEIEKAGEKTFSSLTQAADQVDFSNIADGLSKVKAAAENAAVWEQLVQGVKKVEGAFDALGTAAARMATRMTRSLGVFGVLARSLGPVGIALGVAGGAFIKFGNDSVKSLGQLNTEAAKLNVTVQQFDRLQKALTKLGISSDAVTGSLDQLKELIGGGLDRLGDIAPPDATTRLQQFIAALERMPDGAARTQIAMERLGETLGGQVIAGLQTGSITAENFASALASVTPATQEQIVNAAKQQQAINKLNDAWNTFKADLAAPVLIPVLEWLASQMPGITAGIAATVQEFKLLWEVINQVATVGAGVIGAMVEPVMLLGRAVAWVVEQFMKLVALKSGAGASGGGAPGMAGGGLLGGSGTGTSDSNLAWVSRGEYITPAAAVAQPGVLAFLEALRRSGGNLSRVLNGMGRFALGGMVPRMPAFAAGGLAGGSNVTIAFPGLPPISGLRASSDVVEQLHRAAALAQVRSGGRKPSRYA